MCRVRFRPDGIYLSLLFIERVEEPCCPLEKVYHQSSISPMPQTVIEKRIAAKDLSNEIQGLAEVTRTTSIEFARLKSVLEGERQNSRSIRKCAAFAIFLVPRIR